MNKYAGIADWLKRKAAGKAPTSPTVDYTSDVQDVLRQQLNIDHIKNIDMDSSLMNDMGADDLDLIETVMALEDRYGIDIPDTIIPKNITEMTPNSLVNYLNSKLSKQASAELGEDVAFAGGQDAGAEYDPIKIPKLTKLKLFINKKVRQVAGAGLVGAAGGMAGGLIGGPVGAAAGGIAGAIAGGRKGARRAEAIQKKLYGVTYKDKYYPEGHHIYTKGANS